MKYKSDFGLTVISSPSFETKAFSVSTITSGTAEIGALNKLILAEHFGIGTIHKTSKRGSLKLDTLLTRTTSSSCFFNHNHDGIFTRRAISIIASKSIIGHGVSFTDDIGFETTRVGSSNLTEIISIFTGHITVVIHVTVEVIEGVHHSAFIVLHEEIRADSHTSEIEITALLTVGVAEIFPVLSVVTALEPIATHTFTGLEFFEVSFLDTVPSRVFE
jgi:hypothetical protein